LDNVELPSANYLIPGGKVKTLITTRDKSIALELANPENIRTLKEFTPDQCMELFEKYVNTSEDSALSKLSEFLGYLPYAIRLSAKLLYEFPIIMPNDLIEQYGRNNYTIQERIDMLLERSYNMLSKDEKKLLLCLGNCSLKGIHFNLFRSIFNFDEDYCKNNLYKSNKLSLLEVTNEFILKFHPLTKIFLKNKDAINKYKYLKYYLIGLHKLTVTKRVSYYYIDEIRSCFQNISENRIDCYFKILDNIISNIDGTRYIVTDIISLLIDKCSKMELPIERYINYYFENTKQFKKIGNYDDASKHINVAIDYLKRGIT